MIYNYKTGKLPPNFIALGVMLLALGMWRMIILDWKGIIFFVISLLLLFIKSGVVIDIDNKRIKRYIGLFGIKKGKWEDISSLISLQIKGTREKQSMSVLSISRTETIETHKLYVNLPDKNIELFSGRKKEDIMNKAQKLASSLLTSLINNT